MSPLAIRLSTVTICAIALLAAPLFASAEAGAATRHGHVKKHPRHWRHVDRWSVGPQQPFAAPYRSGWVCPGIGRSFDCKIWPPPIEDDPDRKTSRF
jgi:hypothetical protein